MARVDIYGSTAHGICMAESGCDVDVDLSKLHSSSAQTIRELCQFLKKEMSDEFNIEPLMDTRNPKFASHNRLTLETLNGSGVFNFTTGVYSNGYKTSALLSAYMQLDERAKLLAFSLRYLAKVNYSIT